MTIEEIKKKAIPIFKEYGVEYAGVFGSVARGDNREDSDVDIIVRVGKIPFGIWGFVGLQQELEAKLNCKVDLLSQPFMDPELKNNIEKDIISIYEGR